MPLVFREPMRAHLDHGARRIRAAHLTSLFDEVPGDRHARTAADVEHLAMWRGKQGHEPVEPPLLNQAVAAITRPLQSMTLVNLDDLRRVRTHRSKLLN